MPETSAIRRALLWWFGGPANPWVTINFVVDFAPAQAWLASLPPPRVTVNHLVAAAIGRTLGSFPEANAHVLGKKIVRSKHVGIAMPVNLLGHSGESRAELGLAILERAETLSLRDVAHVARRSVDAERTGRPQNPVVKGMMRLVEAAPQGVVDTSLSLLDRVSQREAVSRRLLDLVPVTTGLSNAGAAMGGIEGMLFRGADVAIPKRLVRIGTFWGTSALQDEVIPVGGQPAVRPMLPVLFLFDHRIIDGVKASRVVAHFGSILRNPAAEFGERGER